MLRCERGRHRGVGMHAGASVPRARTAWGDVPMTAPGASHAASRAADLADRYRAVRAATEALVAPLSPEDCCAQSMPDASPAKWHLAHTTWFFETFVLQPARPEYRVFDEAYARLFNSYYETVGPMFVRARRGVLTRPTAAEVARYRAHVDLAIEALLAADPAPTVVARIGLGLEHEQQHQELLLMDLAHLYAQNPLRPALRAEAAWPSEHRAGPLQWCEGPSGVRLIGHAGSGF